PPPPPLANGPNVVVATTRVRKRSPEPGSPQQQRPGGGGRLLMTRERPILSLGDVTMAYFLYVGLASAILFTRHEPKGVILQVADGRAGV
ncbi:hypothetical protein LY76DRAFT_661253, partial [Colletotrichum caudatum]